MLLAALTFVLVSCATPQAQKKKGAKEIEVKCEPEVLVVSNNKIEADISIVFPNEYLDPNSMLVITPVLVYGEQQRTGKAYIYQGERIMANYKVVPVRGITHMEHISYDFLPGMEQCYLELRLALVHGTNKTYLTPIKVADGCNATYRLVQVSGEYKAKPSGYQRTTTHTSQTSIMFDVNSSQVKNNSANNSAVSVYKSYLSDIKEDQRIKITGTQIVAYASPEGGEKYNAELSDKRAGAAVDVWNKMGAGVDPSEMEVRSIGQDWEGFKEALENSDIEEKDLILRVLSMYSDPAVREAEMKNLSFIYDELKTEVFPSLRRATFVVNAEHTGYSDAELLELAEKQLAVLSEPEVLHLAEIVDDMGLKKFYYRFAAQRYMSATAYFNMAVISLNENQNDIAATYLEMMLSEDADVLNLRGVISMRQGKYEQARRYFLRSATSDAMCNLATLYILEGEYQKACELLDECEQISANSALAYILSNQIDKAIEVSSCDSPRDAYIAAIAYARKGDKDSALKALEKAKEDPVWAEKIEKDVEFVDYR